MTTAIKDIRGITDAVLAECHAHGIKDADHLTDALATPALRKAFAEKAGLTADAVLLLANRTDLARLNGVGGAFGDLLEAAGVDTVKELSHRRADNLHAKIVEVNADKKYAGREPTEIQVAEWIDQAKTLGGKLSY